MDLKAQTRIHITSNGRGVIGINKEIMKRAKFNNKDKLLITFNEDTNSINVCPF